MRRRSGGTWTPGPSTRVSPILIVPASARSNPAISRSRVVFPLPDGPRIAVSDPAGTSRSTPVRTGWDPNDLCSPVTASCRIPSSSRLSRAIEKSPQDVAWYGRDDDHHQGERRGLAVREVRLVGPELSGQRLRPGRDQQQRGEIGRAHV